MNKISIIIPMLNEAVTIEKLLNHISKNSEQKNVADILIVDGGSNDGSQVLVKNFIDVTKTVNNKTNIVLLHSDKGRAKQMNTGANKASGNILYFLHADSFPPKGFDQLIINEIIKNNQAGCFRMQFDHKHWWLQMASWFTQFGWRACRGGDQSQFVTKKLFEKIGGFNERFIIYEDNDFINKLYARKEFTVIQHKIVSSARTYQKNGIWKLQYHFLMIYLKKWLGASAEELHAYYKQHVNT